MFFVPGGSRSMCGTIDLMVLWFYNVLVVSEVSVFAVEVDVAALCVCVCLCCYLSLLPSVDI